MKNTLLTLTLLFSSLLARGTQAAQPSSVSLDMGRAREFAEIVHELRYRKSFMGDFDRGEAHSQDIFDAYDAALSDFLEGDFRVQRIMARSNEIKVRVRDLDTGRDFWMSSIAQKAPKQPSSVTQERLQENLTLTFESSTQWSDTARGSFVSFTEAGDAKTLAAGQRFGIFTVSVFGKLVEQNWTVGAKANARIDLGKGFALGLTAQVSESSRNILNVTEGRYDRRFDRYASASARIQIDKTWSLTGIKTSAGAQFNWVGGASFAANPSAYAFVSVGKGFVNSRGQEIGKLEFLALKQLGMRDSGWMIGLMGSFYF
jgi:hypothetical protein